MRRLVALAFASLGGLMLAALPAGLLVACFDYYDWDSEPKELEGDDESDDDNDAGDDSADDDDNDTWLDDDDDDDSSDCPEGFPSEPACADVVTVEGRQWSQCDNGSDISHYCAVRYADALILGGHNDWRLPTMAELWTLVDPTRETSVECGDDAYIEAPFDLSCTKVWSQKYDETNGWYMRFYNSSGGEGTEERWESGTLRALVVRDQPSDDDDDDDDNDATPYEDCPEGFPTKPICTQTTTIGDLEWTVCDTGENIDHYCAVHYTQELVLAGKSDWRLPTMAELWTLVDAGRETSVECGDTVFIEAPFDLSCTKVWSEKHDATYGWYMRFYNSSGGEGTEERWESWTLRALAVRDVTKDE